MLWFHNHDKGSTMKHMQLSQINTAKKTEVEKVDLGLPLQGPGWTDYACVQGYVGMQLHVIPLDTVYWTELVCVFLHDSPSICFVINSLVSSYCLWDQITTFNVVDHKLIFIKTVLLYYWLLQPYRRKHQADDNQIERVKKTARTYPTEVPSILWDWMFKTVVLLIWVSEENKKH